ncbi:MAG: hypothetical protein ACREQ7_07150 [Candidatus Binatia bacterium]
MKIPTPPIQNTYTKFNFLPTIHGGGKLILILGILLSSGESSERFAGGLKNMGSTGFDNEQERQPEFYHRNSGLDPRTMGLWEEDITTTGEYDRVYRRHQLAPEEELMAAVLDEAIADYQRYLLAGGKRSAKRFAEVERWILEDDSEWIFSFVNCCEGLGIKPGYIRQGLLRWKEEKLPRIALSRLTTSHKKPARKLLRKAA